MSRWSEPTSGSCFSTRVYRRMVADVERIEAREFNGEVFPERFVARVSWRNGAESADQALGYWPSLAEARAACDEYMLAAGGDSNGGCESRVRALEKEVAGLRQRVSDLETCAATFPPMAGNGSASAREFRQSLGREM